ncbi:hypothetical protein [Paraglaciecola sp. MB-3u-78]|jgi:hypothetical protein|uniref:DUF7281 domain-containing protein n=1 Tax=Paraglaciecola sp. MB-3u-78 TaxID=2058332 RepID=UPI000C32F5CF|nr:hypothetical protein [Paraglaciecola sp. MB-3u-78]PKG93031.1 hypothetical protein CXF95_29185 [Paraglaciecola sp. MB-3u-78]
MADDLSLKAKRLLATQHSKLLLDEGAVANASRILNEILNWCDNLEFQPGKWLKPNKMYRFDREYITQINQTLLDEGYASIFDNFNQDNHRSAAQRNPNEKQGQLKPTHHLILGAFTDTNTLDVMSQALYSSQQINIELDIRQLALDNFDCLIVVENRDSFNDWFEYKSYTNLSSPLVIYRGDKHHSTACKRLLKNWLSTQGNKFAIYFGDYDLAALRIAISGGYTHLLLPEYQYLVEQCIKQHYPDNQHKYLARLEQNCPEVCQPLLQLMRDKRAGLRQQKMYLTPLLIYPIDY